MPAEVKMANKDPKERPLTVNVLVGSSVGSSTVYNSGLGTLCAVSSTSQAALSVLEVRKHLMRL